MTQNDLKQSPLGQKVQYPTRYDPSLLFPIERAANRTSLLLPDIWFGQDVWTAYELSWLNAKGKPIAMIGEIALPWDSPKLIESKSLKLYLNSFNEVRFNDVKEVKQIIETDLSKVAEAPVSVRLYELHPYDGPMMSRLEGENIDHLDIEVSHYTPNASLLRCIENADTVHETLVSDLLKSNCPETGQPDWGSVQITYTGKQIATESLLAYIISFRHHTEFHEHCVERMYSDIMAQCAPESLMVQARYTRRGGLDINPWRSSQKIAMPSMRTPRQ